MDAVRRAARLWQARTTPVLALVRHGRTAWNASRRFVGRTDVPLDAVGRAQAITLAERLPGPFHAVYASPLLRARDTAAAVDPAPRVVEDLAELDQGELEGLDGATALARFPDFFAAWQADPERAPVPGGETLGALRARARRALEGIAIRHGPGQVVGVFTHQMVIASLTCDALGLPLSEWRFHRVGNAAVTALVPTGDGFDLVEQDIRLAPEPGEVPGA
jgi:broad specificity phosphatase PhoE